VPERVAGWGMAVAGDAQVARPESRAALQRAFAECAAAGVPLGLRGSGCSYGDASLNSGGRLIDLTGMRRILAFDAASGIARVEPGVTIRDLWRHSIAHGFWPAVVPGTMQVSIGGAAAMNIHGKNNFAVGSFGEHVREFTLLTPEGKLLVCDRERNVDVFHAAIGGFGMLGCFVELTLQLKRVHSGRMRVTALSVPDLDAALRTLEEHKADADYLVGWLDGYARGAALGRGHVHRADHYAPGEDPDGERMLAPQRQDVPPRVLGVVPKSWVWPGMWTTYKVGGWRLVNAAWYAAGRREAKRPPYPQTHGAFHFLLDYVPRWHWAFKPGGLIQFQPFVPREHAATVLRTLIEWCHAARLIPYLLVLKRHRPDPFLMTHAVDGFSLAMDFAVTRGNRGRLWALCERMAEAVLAASGRFYYAKDAVLGGGAFERIHGTAAVAAFRALKGRLDPAGILQTDLARRLMGA
jgi:FAD/FMN-containing dehydrogenase